MQRMLIVLIFFAAESQVARLVNLAGAVVWQGNLLAGRTELQLAYLPKGSYVLIATQKAIKILLR